MSHIAVAVATGEQLSNILPSATKEQADHWIRQLRAMCDMAVVKVGRALSEDELDNSRVTYIALVLGYYMQQGYSLDNMIPDAFVGLPTVRVAK